MSSSLVPFDKLSAPSPELDADDSGSKRQATRVFKKSSSNGKITVYLGKRDFVDHITHVDPIGKAHASTSDQLATMQMFDSNYSFSLLASKSISQMVLFLLTPIMLKSVKCLVVYWQHFGMGAKI